MSKLVLLTLLVLALNGAIASDNKLTFQCASTDSKFCLDLTFGASNVVCPANNEGEIDLLELASQYTLSQPVTYAQSTTYTQRQANEKRWIIEKFKELDLCLFKKNSSDEKVKTLQALINKPVESIVTNECTASLDSQAIINMDVNESPRVDKYISVCEEKITELVNTNQSAELLKTKKHLKDLKDSLVKKQDQAISAALSGSPDAKTRELAFTTKLKTQPQIEKIDEILKTKEQHFLIPSWRDLALSYQFYTGVEYGKVDQLVDNSTIRLGMMTYFRPGKELERLRTSTEGECTIKKICGLTWSIWPHLYGNFVLTGAAESSTSTSSPENQDDGNFDALEYEIGLFWPAYFGSRGSKVDTSYQEIAFGPIINFGGRKVDEVESFLDRHYAGFRLSFNEETYFDLLYGKSDPLMGRRVELRGQLPVSTFGSGRLFLGGAANFEVSRKATDISGNLVKEPDSFKIYITWQTTFDDLWKASSSDSD